MVNNPLISLYIRLKIRRLKVCDAIYYVANNTSRVEVLFDKGVCFDFSNSKYIHLGDILFYIPLILYFQRIGKVYVVCNKVHRAILMYFFSEPRNRLQFIEEVLPGIVVITSPYLLIKYLKNNAKDNIVFGVGLAHLVPDLPYPLYLVRNFLQSIGKIDEYPILVREYNLFINIFRSKKSELLLLPNLPTHIPVVFFSPYISSGKFRDIFNIKFKVLIRIAESIVSKGVTVCLLGTRVDPPVVGFYLTDLRGVDILTLLKYARLPNVIYGFGFDNFWMHYFDIIDKRYDVYFRGRFTYKAKLLHYQSINIAFKSNGHRDYLNDQII